MSKQELTKEQINAINSYSDSIETLKDTVTAIRTLPGMYCAGRGNRGFISLIREIYDNAIDQVVDPTSPADSISVYYNEQTLEVEVSDNGKGFPFNDMVRIVTSQHTSKNYTKNKGEYSSGVHGSGLKVTNALSSECHICSYRYDGSAMQLDLKDGYVVGKGPYSINNKDNKQGSSVRFIPATEVLGDLTVSWETVYNLVRDILMLTPIGSKVYFEGIDSYGNSHIENIINKDGIITKLISNVKSPLYKPIIISTNNGDFKLDVAFTHDISNKEDSSEYITAFCNMCPTIDGEHISGSLDGICKWFCNYMNNIYLANQKAKDKLKIIPNDVKSGLNIIISGFCLDVCFVGQDKQVLAVPDMKPFCSNTIINGLDTWSKSNPQDLAKISKFLKEIAELRMKQDKDKEKIVQKFASSTVTGGLPTKYLRPLSNKNIELILVEGDSAMSNIVTKRDKNIQGVLPLRGKIINAFNCSKTEFFNNQEVQAIQQIMFKKPYSKNLSVDECLIDKLIIMTDADVDGAHISALLLRMIIMYYPQLLVAGKVYKAIPPLYAIKVNGKDKYFTDQKEIVKYIQKNFQQKYKVTTLNNVPLSNTELTNFLMLNTDYIYWIERIANTYALNPYLVELVLNHYVENNCSIDLKKLKKQISSAYRFMNVEKINDSYIIKGVIDKSNFMVFNNKFTSECEELINLIKKNNELRYKVNDNIETIYNIMKYYNASSPSNISRFKGLGEMEDYQLKESTLYPGSDRTLIRYTIDDVKEELESIRKYESDMSQFLKMTGIIKRDDLID